MDNEPVSLSYLSTFTSNQLSQQIKNVTDKINNVPLKFTGPIENIINNNLPENSLVVTDEFGKITHSSANINQLKHIKSITEPIKDKILNSSNLIHNSSSNLSSNIFLTSNKFIRSLKSEELLSDAIGFLGEISDFGVKLIDEIGLDNDEGIKLIVNGDYDGDLTVNGDIIVENNVFVMGEISQLESSTGVFHTDTLDIRPIGANANPLIYVDQTGNSNIMEIFNNNDQKIVVTKEGYVGVGKTNPEYFIDAASNINVTGNYKIDGNNLSLSDFHDAPSDFPPELHTHTGIDAVNSLTTALEGKQDIVTGIVSNGSEIQIDANINLTDGHNFKINGVDLNLENSDSGDQTDTWKTIGDTDTIVQITDADNIGTLPTQIDDYTYYHAFTSTTGTNSITFDRDTVCDILIVGGGASGGGQLGGGGGGGAVVHIQNANISEGTYNVVVGNGGTYVTGTNVGNNGNNSSFNNIIAEGGGGGSYFSDSVNGLSGGSGGGSGCDAGDGAPTPSGGGVGSGSSLNGYIGTIYQNIGGSSVARDPGLSASGGGGAFEIGGDGNVGGTSVGGKGGDGIQINIDGNNYYWGGGGGGSTYQGLAGDGGKGGGGGGSGNSPGTAGDGGVGGITLGANGVINSANSVNGSGGANTGGGGGGGGWSPVSNTKSGDGGSGIVIIRWRVFPQEHVANNDISVYNDNIVVGKTEFYDNFVEYGNMDGVTDMITDTSSSLIVSSGDIITPDGSIKTISGDAYTNNLIIKEDLSIKTSIRDYSSNVLTKYPRDHKFYTDTTDMLLWLKFDGNLLDSSGNGHVPDKEINITYDNTQNIQGTHSLKFNSSPESSYLEYANPRGDEFYFTPSEMTISVWVSNVTQTISGNLQTIASARKGHPYPGWTIYINSDIPNYGSINELLFWYDSGGSYVNWATGYYMNNQIQFQHLLFTMTDDVIKFYLNGIFFSEKDISGGATPARGAQSLRIGAGANEINTPLYFLNDGTILDDVRIYNRALTPEEVRILYQPKLIEFRVEQSSDFYTDTTDMLAWYKFDGDVVDGGSLTNYGNLGSDYNASIKLTDGGIIRVPGDIGQYKYKWTGTSVDQKVGNWINLPDNILEKLNSGYTFSWWSVDNDLTDLERTILSVKKGTDISVQPSQTDILLSAYLPYGNTKIYWDFGDGLSNYQRLDTQYTPPEGELANWVVTKEIIGSNQLIKVYRNNVLIMSGTYVNKDFPSGDNDNMIGVNSRLSGGAGQFLDKSLEDFRIYNRALTPEEVTTIYNCSTNYKAFNNNKSLVGWVGETPTIDFDTEYPGQYLKIDLGEYILPKQLTIAPVAGADVNKQPKDFRLYGAQILQGATIYEEGTLRQPTNIPGTNDWYYAFTSTSGTNSITFNEDTECDILVVGGGGGGGKTMGGGGGSGGAIYITNALINAGKYDIVIGRGGNGSTSGIGENGGNTSVFNAIALGGGGGGGPWNNGSNGTNGGSGGGGGGSEYANRNGGTSGNNIYDVYPLNTGLITNYNGNNGGIGYDRDQTGSWRTGGGGGGGIGTPGQNGTKNSVNTYGDGGDGVLFNITGIPKYFAGGGGGGNYVSIRGGNGGKGGGGGGASTDYPGTVQGLGGIDGGESGKTTIGGNGGENTGGGGGGGAYNGSVSGGNGGSGIVVIRWTVTNNDNYMLLLDHTGPSVSAPSTEVTYQLSEAPKSCRYFTLVVQSTYESSMPMTTKISEMELYGYEQRPFNLTKFPRYPMDANIFNYPDGSGITVRCTGSSIYSGYIYYNAFNKNVESGWASLWDTYNTDGSYKKSASFMGTSGEWIMIDLGEQIVLNNIKIYPRILATTQYRCPKTFKIYASNDKDDYDNANSAADSQVTTGGWIEIYDGNNTTDGSQETPYIYIISQHTPYRYYTMVVSEIFPDTFSALVEIRELEFWGHLQEYTTDISNKSWKVSQSTSGNDLVFSTSHDNGNSLIPRSAISASRDGSYTNFTGIHHCKAEKEDLYDDKYIGMIVSSTKKYQKLNSVYDKANIQRNMDKSDWDCLPVVALTSKENDKEAFGIITKIEDIDATQREIQTGFMKHYYDKESFDRRLHIAGVGEGGIWVCDCNGNIESGDYISSSVIGGYGMKQSDDVQHNYTVAKATMNCDFNPKILPVKVIATSNIAIDIIDKSDLDLTSNIATSTSNIVPIEPEPMFFERIYLRDDAGNYTYEELIDENGEIVYEAEYEIRYINSENNFINELEYASDVESCHKVAFIGCSYHCS
jgi:hypothetical protein